MKTEKKAIKSDLKPQLKITKNPKNILPLIISSLKNPQNPSSTHILKSCSTKLLHHSSSLSSSSFLKTHLNTILAVIPAMLFRPEIIGTVAKIVGCLSLVSFEVNEMISGDGVILKGLCLVIVGCGDNRVLMGVLVDVLLDVCVTGLGRRSLVEVSGLDYVIWEGFAHVALHGWSQRNQTDCFASDTSMILRAIYVNFLHVAIRLISRTEPVLRKACLVAASSFPQETKDWLDENQRVVFTQVINKVHELANYTDSVNFVKMTLQQNEDPFLWLRWLDHLNEKDEFHRNSFNTDLTEISKILSSIDEDKAKAEVAFDTLKSQFCDEVLFDDARERFKSLHYVYREGRMQFMNGMRSLHY